MESLAKVSENSTHCHYGRRQNEEIAEAGDELVQRGRVGELSASVAEDVEQSVKDTREHS